jgi:hypothetical protein
VKRFFFIIVPLVGVLGALYFWLVLNWNYSSGERAGWVQKFSKKGWICKTWEGELAMVSLPGTTQEKFMFTVWDDEVAGRVNKAMGQRVSLHYEEKIGLPSSCFGETRHWVTNISIVPEVNLLPNVTVPMQPQPAPAPQPAPPAQAAPPPAQPTPQPAQPAPPPAPTPSK